MSTTTAEPTHDTTTSTVPDVDLEAVPACEAGEKCAGERGPAVARLRFNHACDHVETLLVCAECVTFALAHWWQPVSIECAHCEHLHACLLAIHASLLPL